MESQFGLAHVWAQGDWVSKSIVVFLLIMSIASWLVIVLRTLSIWRGKRQAAQARAFWDHGDMQDAVAA